MRAAVIENARVVNIIEVEALDVLPDVHIVASDNAEIGDLWDGQKVVRAPRPIEPLTQLDYTRALETMYDTKARERHYDNRFTCALRAGYAGPFRAEGTAFATWMDTCNAQAYTIMAEVLGGQRAAPTIPALLALMPPMVWP